MMRFRVRIWRDGGFWNPAVYAVGRDSKHVRAKLEREHGREVARNSAVTAYADVVEGLHPSFRGVK